MAHMFRRLFLETRGLVLSPHVRLGWVPADLTGVVPRGLFTAEDREAVGRETMRALGYKYVLRNQSHRYLDLSGPWKGPVLVKNY